MKCITPYCRGVRTPAAKSSFCGKCRTRRFKAAHPLRYSFSKLKSRAKERGKPFKLTFAEYQAFAVQTGYDKLKGKTKQSLSIHRKDDRLGYVAGNIAAVTLSDNSRLKYAALPGYLQAELAAIARASA